MSQQSVVFADEAGLISPRTYYRDPLAAGVESYNLTVPAGAAFLRATVLAAGSQGGSGVWGGGGALARSTVPVTVGENIKSFVGDVSTGSTRGDSWVKRNDNTVIAYADRGRGAGPAGLAANSVGTIRVDGGPGAPGIGGPPASDAAFPFPVIGTGRGAQQNVRSADPGGGGILIPWFDEYAQLSGYVSWPGGTGQVVLEFFDTDPGY